MKRLALFKSASDFAYSNIEVTDQVELAQSEVTAFKSLNINSADFGLWKQYAAQCRQQFQQLAQQLAPSAVPAQPAGVGRNMPQQPEA